MRVEQSKIDRIKEIQLEMLSEINDFCRENDIKYTLAYGSLLGAIRHKGYIPWDDDLDLWMTRENFEIFKNKYVSKINKLCTMSNTTNYPFYMAKIINKNTKLMENGVKHINFDYGVYIDIFVLDYLPKNKFVRELKLARNYILYLKLEIKYSSKNNLIYRFLKKIIKPSKIETKQAKLWSKYNNGQYKDDSTLCMFGIKKRNKKYIFNSEWFNDIIDVKFENLVCYAPKYYDEILKSCYGDYMKLPPIEQREVHQYISFEEIKGDN